VKAHPITSAARWAPVRASAGEPVAPRRGLLPARAHAAHAAELLADAGRSESTRELEHAITHAEAALARARRALP
jgi:hypothetical protein